MSYATVEQVETGFRTLDADEKEKCNVLLEEAAIIIDSYSSSASASDDQKRLVSCNMVRRAVGEDDAAMMAAPMGATQGSMSALGYSQTWTLGSGSAGELYLSKLDKRLLGVGNRIGAHSPVEDLCDD